MGTNELTYPDATGLEVTEISDAEVMSAGVLAEGSNTCQGILDNSTTEESSVVPANKNARLRVLERSLERKTALFDQNLGSHFSAVKAANGQPLNDKKNGASTLSRWEKQDDALRRLAEGIEKTKRAIERETSALERASSVLLPAAVQSRLAMGLLTQWRRHPTTFFVAGVDKARIVLLPDGTVGHRYTKTISDPVQWRTFAKVFNELSREIGAQS